MFAHKSVRVSILSVLTLLVLAGPSSHGDVKENLSEYFRRAEHYGFSGSVLVARGDQVLLEEAYGYADHASGTRATVDTAYDVGSVTKQFTAAAILHLESRGKLTTGDSIGDHLDFVPEDKKAITLHHLLTHTSGFRDSYWDQNRSLTEEAYLQQQMEKGRLRGSPGAQFQYTNFGYHLLAAIVERVSGVDYEAYLRKYLFLPTDMQNTGFHEPDWAEGQVAQYQDWSTRGSMIQVQDPLKRPVYLQPEGSGGILSTPRDLFKWHRSLEKNTVLSTDATSRMFTPHLNRYGYGWRIRKTARGTKLIEHGGYDTWLGTLAGFYRFVDEDVVIIILANSTLNGTLRHPYLVHQIENMLFDESFSMPPEPQPINPKTLALYTGVYTIAPGETINVLVRNERLIAVAESPAAVRLLMFPNSGKPMNKTKEDSELTSLLKALEKNKFEAESHAFDSRVDIERFVRRWTGALKRMERDRGKLKRISEVHSHEFFFGEPETQHFAYLEFADGQEIFRAIRTEPGWLALDVFSLPERLELTLAPGAEGQFYGWDFRLGMGPQIFFTPGSGTQSLEMHILGDRARSIAKRNLHAPAPNE